MGKVLEFYDYGFGSVLIEPIDQIALRCAVLATRLDKDHRTVWNVLMANYYLILMQQGKLKPGRTTEKAFEFVANVDADRLQLHSAIVETGKVADSEIVPLAIATRAILSTSCSKRAALLDAEKQMAEINSVIGRKHFTKCSYSEIEKCWRKYINVIHLLDAFYMQVSGNPIDDPIRHSEEVKTKLMDKGLDLSASVSISVTYCN